MMKFSASPRFIARLYLFVLASLTKKLESKYELVIMCCLKCLVMTLLSR